MANNAGWLDDKPPTSPPSAHSKISVFVVEKKTLFENADVCEVACSEENRCTAPRTDVFRVVELTGIDFTKAALVTNPRIVKPRADIVHNINRPRCDIYRELNALSGRKGVFRLLRPWEGKHATLKGLDVDDYACRRK
jgi:hypothetical protein